MPSLLYQYGLPVFLVLLVLPCDLILMNFYTILQPGEKIPKGRAAGFMAVTAFLFYAMGLWGMPLPLFYLALFMSKCLFFLFLRGRRVCRWFVADMGILAFTSVHLLIIGLMAFILQTDTYSILLDFSLRNLSVILAAAIDIVAGVLIVFYQPVKEKARIMGQGGEEFRLLIKFSWFGMGYVLFDCISSMFSQPSAFAALFLIGSVILLLLQVYLFMSHVYTISKNAYLEEEHIKLEVQRTEQIKRTHDLRKTAYIDGLTGAYTRLFALEQMRVMLEEGEMFSIAYIDLDHLKKINDTYGHAQGDRYLADFASVIRQNIWRSDIFARFGGDEFLVLFPRCGEDRAYSRMAQLRGRVCGIRSGETLLSFSFGITSAPEYTEKTIEQLLCDADRMMYADKQRRQ